MVVPYWWHSRLLSHALLVLFFLTIAWHGYAADNTDITLTSHDRNTELVLLVNEYGDLSYQVNYKGTNVISPSLLGLYLSNGKKLGERTIIGNTERASHRERFEWTFGERTHVENVYEEMTVNCSSFGSDFQIVFRLYNDAVAFKYVIPAETTKLGKGIDIEYTSFNFPTSTQIYQHSKESEITLLPVKEMDKRCDFPATVVIGDLYIVINEAHNSQYTKAELESVSHTEGLKTTFVNDKVVFSGDSFETPWRTIAIAEKAIDLISFSDLNYRLSPPSVVDDTSIFKPGKFIRAMKLNTENGLACIDFAAENDYQYILLDAGWYGKGYAAEFDPESDPRVVVPELDLHHVINYGKEKGIGVLVYVNHVALKNHLDEILDLYKSWGISGLKFGFVDGLSQKGIKWIMAAVEKAARYGFVIDIHDNYKPTGMSRTFPNLLTQEGIRGNERVPDAYHNAVLPFTRFLSGAADYTFCFPGSTPASAAFFSKKVLVSKAHQLSLSVIYYSPLQAMLWYGLPQDYQHTTDVEFFKRVPTFWDETIGLKGEIGKYVSIARRKDDVWYVGNITAFSPWEDHIKLDFLASEQQYNARLYEDGADGNIRITEMEVNANTEIPLKLPAKGGLAIIIEKQK